jgi:hypothetical protein
VVFGIHIYTTLNVIFNARHKDIQRSVKPTLNYPTAKPPNIVKYAYIFFAPGGLATAGGPFGLKGRFRYAGHLFWI